MLPAVPATCLPDKPQEGHGQEELRGGSKWARQGEALPSGIYMH